MDSKAKSGDPGWNDPPLFSYDEHTAQINSPKPRTLLNKRISFPMETPSSSIGNKHHPVDPTLPLRPCNPNSLPPPPLSKIESPKKQIDNDEFNYKGTDDFNSEQASACIIDNFNSILSNETSELKNKNEIERRLDIMKKMWSEGKFNKDIQKKLLQLSEAVKEKNISVANDLQISLMVDHPSLCSPWMSGIRHMIQHGVEEPYIS